MYKIKNGLAPDILKEIFHISTPAYNLRNKTDIYKPGKIYTMKYGTNSVSYLAPKIWQLLPLYIRNASSLQEFKFKIKTWNTESYIQVPFIFHQFSLNFCEFPVSTYCLYLKRNKIYPSFVYVSVCACIHQQTLYP